MYYRLHFRDGAGHPLTLVGHKEVRDERGFDVWSDTSTLYTRILAGHVAAGEEPEAELIATGILHILPRDFARQMTTFRVRPAHRLDAIGRFGAAFAGHLWKVYGGRARAVTDELIPFTAGDGVELNLIHVRGRNPPTKPPVLLVHGAGVRANIFRAPSGRTLVDVLVDEGWDVWLENWRASIDIPRRRWTLDDAALHDHPAAVRTVLEHTKADEVRAVIHCQGSTSFMMSAVAGLVPDVSVVVSNAVSLHPVVNRKARLKLRWMIPPTARVMGYLDPQWGETGAPWVLPKLISGLVRVTHRECDNMVCKLASFTYGTGEPTLWRHENLNRETHEWLRHEFADVPLTFFEQILRSVEAGHLVAADSHPGLPRSFVDEPPKTKARFAFFAGALNACFEPESQLRTQAWFEGHDPGRHTATIVPNYGHLDIFMGAHAANDVFPDIVSELERT